MTAAGDLPAPRANPAPGSNLSDFIEQLRLADDGERQIPFSEEEYANRLGKLRAAMAADGVDVVVLSSPEAMCWLHGYALRWYKSHSPRRWKPLACTVVHVDHDRYITFEGAEHERMLRRTSVSRDNRFLPRYQRDQMLEFIVAELHGEGWLSGRVGLEKYSYIPNSAVSAQIETAFGSHGATIVDASDAVLRVRRTKSRAEIAFIEEAARICDAGLAAVDNQIAVGMSELEVWATMVNGMVAAGGEPAAIHELAVIGNGGIGHAISSRRRAAMGERMRVDPCGVFNHYHANISRSYYFGEPPAEMVRLNELLWGAYGVLCSTAKSGTPVREVNRALREYYVETGLWEHKDNTWIGGYELGLSFPPDWVGEWLFTVAEEDPEDVFEDAMVTNYESIVEIDVLDTLVYGPEGARTLSKLPHEIVAVER
jgi:Xaa-Pro dipeptidase